MEDKHKFETQTVGRVLAFSAAAVALLGLAVLAGLGAPRAPSPAMVPQLRALTLGTVLVAGLADGITPCAFTVLLLFVTGLLAAAHPALNRLAHWNLHRRERVRLGLGTGVVVMGFVILATV